MKLGSKELKFINQVEPYVTENEIKAVEEYLRSGGWLTEFEKTRQFEKMIAEFLGVKHAVVVTNGTVGLYLAALATGIGKGDSVVIPDYTMIASPNAVKWANADVSLCDVRKETLCLDLNRIKLGDNVRGIMHVEINGRAGDMKEIVDFCKDHRLLLIEDACQAFGSRWNGKQLGTFGDVGVFSFTPHKIITTGQGGAIVTNNDELYAELLRLKDFSRIKPGADIHTGIGYNFKFTDLQSVIGIEQLKLIDFRMKRKREIYKRYMEQLQDSKFDFLPIDLSEVVPWFIDVICAVPRERVITELKRNQIGSRPFYPPIHTQMPYRNLEGDYSVASALAQRGLWLPSSVGLEDAEVDRVTSVLLSFSS